MVFKDIIRKSKMGGRKKLEREEDLPFGSPRKQPYFFSLLEGAESKHWKFHKNKFRFVEV